MAKFGEEIGISSSAVNLLEHGKNKPAERTIMAICHKFGISRKWLETGEGDMYILNGRSAKAIEWANAQLASEEDTFQKRFLEALSRLDSDGWDLVEQFMSDVWSEAKKEGSDDEPPEP